MSASIEKGMVAKFRAMAFVVLSLTLVVGAVDLIGGRGVTIPALLMFCIFNMIYTLSMQERLKELERGRPDSAQPTQAK